MLFIILGSKNYKGVMVMEIITYDLKANLDNSDKFYSDISIFTDEVINTIDKFSKGIIEDYMSFVKKSGNEELRGKNEYLLEFLILGVLWNNYINNARKLDGVHEHMLTGLVSLRKNGGVTKRAADFLRGIFSTIFLMKRSNDKIKFSIDNLDKLLDWLSASGEFSQEVKKLNGWEKYLLTKFKGQSTGIIEVSTQTALWFKERSCEVLGKYTDKVESFLDYEKREYSWREDYLFCGRRRDEYHLNMVGAEILNREYRKKFLATKEKLLLLPACMRALDDDSCKSIKTDEGYVCMKCTGSCRVNNLTSMGEKNGFKVLIIPHESDAFKNRNKNIEETGIIGVACVLNLISGGLKADALGFIPQCVFLDYCGCKKHWHNKGFSTDINISRLIKLLNE